MTRLVDFLKGLTALALLLLLLVGVPAALLVIVGFPLPTEMPDPALVRRHLEDGDVPDLFVVKTLAVLVWVVWIQLAVAVLTEFFAVLRGRAASRAPVLPAIQVTARTLVASTALIMSALTPTRSAAAAPIVPIDTAVESLVSAAPGPGSDPAQMVTATVGADGVVELDPSGGAPGAAASGRYKTGSTDNWWEMAERLLGDGMRWSELRNLNEGKVMLTGETITARTETVRPGWMLDVPADADPDLLEFEAGSVGIAADAGVDVAAGAENGAHSDAEVGRVLGAAHDSAVKDPAARDSAADGGPGLLARALKPELLVYEGATGVIDDGPGIPYQVVEGDNLWDIADRHLGDPFRWPEIYERSNQLDQPVGHRITDPNLIWPDSVLWLPTDASDVPTADAGLVRRVVGPVTPVEGDEAPAVVAADDLAELSRRAAEAAPEDPGRPDAEGLALPGRPDRDGDDEGRDPDPIGDLTRSPAGAGFGVGGAALAAGLLGLLVRARRVRMTEAEEGRVPAPPPMDLVEIETVLRNSADRRQAVSVHSAIRSLADRPIVAGEPLAAPEVVRLSAERIEVVQQGPDPDLPRPWLPTEGGSPAQVGGRSSAVLPAEFFPRDAPADDARLEPVAPTMVTVGGGLMLNLEAVGVLAIEGRPEVAAGLVRSMVHELATGPARRAMDIRVSNWLPGADLHEHVLCSPLDQLAEEVAPWMEDVELALNATGHLSAYAVRAVGLGRSLAGPKVIFAEAADVGALAPILDRARRRRLPLAVVVAGRADEAVSLRPTATIVLGEETLRLEPYGFTAAMQYLDVDLILGTEQLIGHARTSSMVTHAQDERTIHPVTEADTDPSQASTEETPQREVVTELPADEHDVTDRSDPEAGILIRVLGPVEFDGGSDDLIRDLSDEERSLLTFLAVVGPSSRARIEDAVWPGRPRSDERWNEMIEALRGRLGSCFPEGGDDRYRVRSVMTDLGAARRWITRARSMSDERMRNLMQLALSDVRGRPFADLDHRAWQWIEDHKLAVATQATSLLLDACFDLCDSAHEANDIHLAKWACDVGAMVDPLNETLVTRRAQLMVALGLDGEANALVEHWETLYEESASRIAPFGPRLALEATKETAPHVG